MFSNNAEFMFYVCISIQFFFGLNSIFTQAAQGYSNRGVRL